MQDGAQGCGSPSRDAGKFYVDESTTKSEVARVFGLSSEGRIRLSRTGSDLVLFSDPWSAEHLGHNFDGWSAEGAGVYYFKGEGQSGDQQLARGNRHIYEHAKDGVSLRVFVAAHEERLSPLPQVYLGRFQIDPPDPYRPAIAPDRQGKPRRVLVFKLVQLDDTGP